MASTFKGVFPAMVTPMTADEEVDCSTLADVVNYLIDAGVGGLIPLGSTGEYYVLSAAEREAVLKGTLEAADGRVPVLAGTNAGATREVVDYSRQAEQLGAAGVLLSDPSRLFDHTAQKHNGVSLHLGLAGSGRLTKDQ